MRAGDDDGLLQIERRAEGWESANRQGGKKKHSAADFPELYVRLLNRHGVRCFGMTGIIPPLVTPLLDDALARPGRTLALVEHVISGGVNGIFLLGSTGEMASLSHALREQLIRETGRLVNGPRTRAGRRD